MGHVIRFSSISDIFENTSLECSFQKKRTVPNLTHSFTITTKMRMRAVQRKLATTGLVATFVLAPTFTVTPFRVKIILQPSKKKVNKNNNIYLSSI